MFAQQNSAGLALTVADPVLVDDLGLLGAVINLWEILAGGIPAAPPVDPPAGDVEALDALRAIRARERERRGLAGRDDDNR